MVRETDIPEGMQSYAMELAHQALDAHEVSDCQSIAHFIKQVNLKISHPFNSIFSGCLRWRKWHSSEAFLHFLDFALAW